VDTCIDITLCIDSTNYDTKLYVFEGDTSNVLDCNDDACTAPLYPYPYVSELVGLQLTANTNYYIVVDGYGGGCGNYSISVTGVPCPPEPPDCPPNSIFSQRTHAAYESGWGAGVSDLRTGSGFSTLERFESYSVNQPFDDIHWWGLSLAYPWALCDENPMTFDIRFYQDVAGMPGPLFSTYTVTVAGDTAVPPQWFNAVFPLLEYGTDLVPACNLLNGWVSIQGVSVGTPVDCWFLWMSSPFGDGMTYMLEADTAWTTYDRDMSLCLTIEEPAEEWDLGDIDTCNYPTLVCNPSHDLTGIAWLGPGIDGEATPNQYDLDAFDDGVVYHNLPWMPCCMQSVTVEVTAGPNYMMFEYMGGHLYLNGWKDGNLDLDFADTLCMPTCLADEWIVQDVLVYPGFWTFQFMDPGVLNMGHYDGVFRWRLTSQPIGRNGFGLVDNTICPNIIYGTIAHDYVGEE
jgi:hypothetical protein